MLGQAIVSAWLDSGAVQPQDLILMNRSGEAKLLDRWRGLRVTTAMTDLLDASDVLFFVIPPDQARALKLAAEGKLIISVMAGITVDQLRTITSSTRIVRAMSSPAAELHMAFSPWYSQNPLSDDDTRLVTSLLSACGTTACVDDEDHIDRFTALTGPVPGFVATFADAMIEHAVSRGIPGETARMAIRQLFLSAGKMMSEGKSPGDHVTEMVDYAGTTAAGITALRDLGLYDVIAGGLEAAYGKAKTI